MPRPPTPRTSTSSSSSSLSPPANSNRKFSFDPPAHPQPASRPSFPLISYPNSFFSSAKNIIAPAFSSHSTPELELFPLNRKAEAPSGSTLQNPANSFAIAAVSDSGSAEHNDGAETSGESHSKPMGRTDSRSHSRSRSRSQSRSGTGSNVRRSSIFWTSTDSTNPPSQDQPLLNPRALSRTSFGDAHASLDAEDGRWQHRLSSASSSGDLTEFERAWSQRRRGFQVLAVACALLISVGSHYSAHTLGALKSTIKKELDITNTQYGALQSTVSAVNTILPILGGLFIDSFGTTTGSLVATSLIMVGNLIISISTHHRSFSTMVAGRILYGLGSGTITVVQETILGSWFKGKGLAITIAIQITTSRIASFLSMGTAIPVAEHFDFYGAAFWANFIVCALSFGINLVYMAAMRHIHREASPEMLARLRSKHKFNPRLVLFFFGIYWLIIVESFTVGAGWTSFLHINSELVKLRFGVNDTIAAWSASVSQIMPIFIVPFLGWFFDFFGLRTDMLIASTATFTVSMLLLGFTKANPLIGLVIFSISLALGPLAEITAISLILPTSSLGTGLGIYKSAMNIGSTIVDIVVGVLQDRGSRIVEDSEHSYDYVMVFFVVWGALSTLVAGSVFLADRLKWNSLLRSNASRRKEAYHIVKAKIGQPILYASAPNWRAYVTFWNYIPLATLAVLLAISWVLFGMKLA